MTIISATQEVEIVRMAIRGQSGQKDSKTPISTNGWAQWHTLLIPAVLGCTSRRITVQAGRGIKQDPISKITSTKRVGAWFKWQNTCPSECEVLSSIPSTAKQNPTFSQ
jgi:hypothetical protein